MFPNIQKDFTKTKLTTKSLNNHEKETVFDILNNVGFYDVKHTKGLSSARMNDVLYILPKSILKSLSPLLPAIEKLEGFIKEKTDEDLEGQGI